MDDWSYVLIVALILLAHQFFTSIRLERRIGRMETSIRAMRAELDDEDLEPYSRQCVDLADDYAAHPPERYTDANIRARWAVGATNWIKPKGDKSE